MLEIGASIARLETDVAKANRTIDGFARSASSAFKIVAGYAMGSAVTSFVKDTATAFMESERAINKMAVAMKNQGDFSKAGLEGFRGYAQQIQETTAYEDDLVLSVMANLKTYGMLNEEVKRATAVALDYAAAKKEEGVTVESASQMLGKAYLGITTGLKKQGIQIDETADKAKVFDSVLAQLQSRTGGAAAAELDTYGGRWANLANTWNDAKKSIGEISLSLGETFQPAIRTTIGLLKEAADYWKDFMSPSAKKVLEDQRAAILRELKAIEDEYPSPKMPNFFGADTDRVPANVIERYRALEQQHLRVRASLAGIQKEEEKVSGGGKRTKPIFDDEMNKKQQEWLRDYLHGVDLRWDAEVKSSNQIGELYMLDVKWKEEALAKQLKQEDEYMKTLEDIKVAQAEGEAAAREEMLEKMKKEQDEMLRLTERTAKAMQDNFSSLFVDVMQGKLEGFRDFVSRIFQSIQQMAADMLAQIATEAIFGKLSKAGGGGGLLGAIVGGVGSLLGSIMHDGGVVGAPAPLRVVPLATFANAPRLHGGLGSDEFPAILQRGEKVIPKSGNTQNQPQSINVVINAVDAASFSELAARNPSAILGPFLTALQRGGQVRNAIRNVM